MTIAMAVGVENTFLGRDLKINFIGTDERKNV